MSKGSAPQTPNYGAIAADSEEAARIQQEISMEQLDWAREMFYENQDLLDLVLEQQLPAMEEQIANARQDRDYYQSVFRPLEVDLAAEAEEYASPEKIELDAARASAGVAQAYDQQRQQALRQLEGYGIDPGQTRFNALDRNLRGQQAAAQAGAANKQREATENIGRALRGEAINMGRGLPTDISRAYGQGVAAGQTGVQGALNTTMSGAQTMGTGMDWAGMSNASRGMQINALNTGYQNQLAGFNADVAGSAGYGQLAGTALGAYMGGMPANSGIAKTLYGVYEEGGEIPTTGNPPIDPNVSGDNQLAAVKDGEYVIPFEVVHAKGTDFFDKLVEKYTGKNPSEEPQETIALEDGGQVPFTHGLPLYEGGGSVTPMHATRNTIAPAGAGIGAIPVFEEGGARQRYAAHQKRFSGGNTHKASPVYDRYQQIKAGRSDRRQQWADKRAGKPAAERLAVENRKNTAPVSLGGRPMAADVVPSGYEVVDIQNLQNPNQMARRMAIPNLDYTYDVFDEELGRNRSVGYTNAQLYENMMDRHRSIYQNLRPGERYFDPKTGRKFVGGVHYPDLAIPVDPSRPYGG